MNGQNERVVIVEIFYYQLMHIMLKNTELLKHSKITLQHVSVYIETIFRELQSVLGTVHDTHALQVTICSHSTDDALHIFYADTVNQMCNF